MCRENIAAQGVVLEKVINSKISYIEATEYPLSADIGVIRDGGNVWLYDVGNRLELKETLTEWFGRENCFIVLSHFHQDHIGSLPRLLAREDQSMDFQPQVIYVSKETYRHVHRGRIVNEEFSLGGLHIFPLPSSHAKGCLGLEVEDTYAFVGDALYCKRRGQNAVYNAQILKEEIAVLKKLKAPYLLVSHWNGLVRRKSDVIAELEYIYQKRVKNSPEIILAEDYWADRGKEATAKEDR